MTSSPAEFTRFIGRRRELTEVRRLLSTSRLVTLTGIGGAGKTRLARKLMNELARAYPDGSWLVELADLHDEDLLGHAVAGALGLQVQSSDGEKIGALSQLTDFLSGREVLLILDNCEHLNDACARLVRERLQACPGLKVLATSRQPLGISGESVFSVPPMSVPDVEHLPPLDAMDQFESVTLFVDRASSAMPAFKLTDENFGDVARLVVALDGVPLAIELAAARTRVLSPSSMLERINDRYRLLSRGYRDAPPRQQSLMASVDWSFDLCTPEESTLWSRLSVFTGGFALDGAEAVCSGDGLEVADVLDLVSSLLDKSLLVRDEGEPVRYRMLETIRQYGVARLVEAGELEQWQARHREWHVELAERAHSEWVGPHQVEWLDRQRIELPNFRAVLEHAVTVPATASFALRLVIALEPYWICSGQLSEARRWLDLALAHGTGSDHERALAQREYAWFAMLQTDLDAAARHVGETGRIADSTGDPLLRAYHLYAAGLLSTWQEDVERGIDQLAEAASLFVELGHLNAQSELMFLQGLALGFAGRHEEAAEMHRAGVAFNAARGELYSRAYSLWGLGADAILHGDLAEATRLQRESLRMKVALGDQLGIALTMEALAWVAAAEARGERAALLLGAAEAIWRVIGISLTDIPYISAQRQTGEDLARGTLSEQVFVAQFKAGLALTQAEAVSTALEEVVQAQDRPVSTEESPLTPREEEVAELLAEGLSNREVAARLVISVRTAQGHVENILRKLGFSSRTQVAAWVAGRRAAEGQPRLPTAGRDG